MGDEIVRILLVILTNMFRYHYSGENDSGHGDGETKGLEPKDLWYQLTGKASQK